MIRLYVDAPLCVAGHVRVEKEQKHYLEKVMRMTAAKTRDEVPALRADALVRDDTLIVFNNKDGEFLASYASGVLTITAQTRPFTPLPKKALAFGLIKKHRLAWLMEKACELGATDLYPLVTQRVQFKDVNPDRYQRIVIEAAEQCGRMDLPVLHGVGKIGDLPRDIEWGFGAIAREEVPDRCASGMTVSAVSYIIGPEGGFTREEETTLSTFATPISMGPLILRAETAALWALSR